MVAALAIIAAVITSSVVTSSISCRVYLTLVDYTYASLVQPLVSYLLTLTGLRALSVTASFITLPSVGVHIVYRLAVLHEADVVCPALYYEGAVVD